jgi:thioesterase domain-containing protein
LRTVQPHGPYLLGGFSGGGITAYEMARQLEVAGERVALLVMLDTPVPMRPALTPVDRAIIKWQELRRDPGFLWRWARNRLEWELGKLNGRPLPDAATDDGVPQFHDLAIEAAFRAALPLYRLQRREGALVLFRPALDRCWQVSGGRWVDGEREYVFEDNDWTRWAPRTQVFEVPGDHDSMVLEPSVRVLGARVRAVLEDAQRIKPEPPER